MLPSKQIQAVVAILATRLVFGFPSGVGRLTQAEWSSFDERGVNGPGTYMFGYDVDEPPHYRLEERFSNGTVIGSYGLLEPNGNVRIVTYRADETGFRVSVENSQSGIFFYPPLTSELGPPVIEAAESPQLEAAIQSAATLGPLQEQHTPPKHLVPPVQRNAFQQLHSRMNLYHVIPSLRHVFK